MKTYEDLMKHYWGVIVPMSKAAGIKPWECVRGQIGRFLRHPNFDGSPEDYTFALSILEGKPVFVGDKIYCKADGALITVGVGGIILLPENWSWTPPANKRRNVHDPMRWAEGLIEQLPDTHEGANSWLLNHGDGDKADLLRQKYKEDRSNQNAV